mmetsp:Transcript_35672/g.93292  ORF Transcript_35672/g.93292 Transcript_35672/m.93292 type:complete len:125 (+) Transcript_35672:77-451(+)
MRVVICSAVLVAGYNGTCPAAGKCSSGSDAGLPCCQISEDSYECCYTAESCIPKVGCRCRRAESSGLKCQVIHSCQFIASFHHACCDLQRCVGRWVQRHMPCSRQVLVGVRCWAAVLPDLRGLL